MSIQRKFLTIFVLLLAVPFLTAGARAAQPQGGGGGGPRPEGGRRGMGPMSPDERVKQMTRIST